MTPKLVYVVHGGVAKDALSFSKAGDTAWLGWTPEAGGGHASGDRVDRTLPEPGAQLNTRE